MSKSRHTEAQIIGALKQLEAGRKAGGVAREVGVSKHPNYAWKAKYGGRRTLSRSFFLTTTHNWMIPLRYVNAE